MTPTPSDYIMLFLPYIIQFVHDLPVITMSTQVSGIKTGSKRTATSEVHSPGGASKAKRRSVPMSGWEKDTLQQMDQTFEVNSKDKVFFSPELMAYLLRFLDASSILSSLEAGVGCLAEILKSEFLRHQVLQHLLILPTQDDTSKGDVHTGDSNPLLHHSFYKTCRGEIQAYMEILSFVGCNNDTEFKKVIDYLVTKFPVLSKKKSGSLTSPSVILVNFAGDLTYMSSASFILGDLAERTKMVLNDKKGPTVTGHNRSFVGGSGCVNGALLHALVGKSDRDGFSYFKMDVDGFHIDSLQASEELLSLTLSSGDIGRRLNSGSFVSHIQISAGIGKAGWRNIHRAMSANPSISWGTIETTVDIFREAETDVVLGIWEILTGFIQLVTENQKFAKVVRFSRSMEDWSLLRLFNLLEGTSTNFNSLIDFLC